MTFSLRLTSRETENYQSEKAALKRLASARRKHSEALGCQDVTAQNSNADEDFVRMPGIAMPQIKMEIQSAQHELETIEADKKLLHIHSQFSSVRYLATELKYKLKQHGAVLDWIEQQHKSIVSETSQSFQLKQSTLQKDREGGTPQEALKQNNQHEPLHSDIAKENQDEAGLETPSIAITEHILCPRVSTKRWCEIKTVKDERPAKKPRRAHRADSTKTTLPKRSEPNPKREILPRSTRNGVQKVPVKPKGMGEKSR